MALQDKSLFLYGFTIDDSNQNIPFKISGGGSELNAEVTPGDYTLSTLADAIETAMHEVDTSNVYTVTVNRTSTGNLQNRITISTSGAFLSILFSTGSTAATSIRSVISFGSTDRTGATTYTNSLTSGTALQTAWYANNFQWPTSYQRSIGNLSIAANGQKEFVYWSTQYFMTAEFKWESEANVLAYWAPLITWMIQQRPFEFTPETNVPNTFYSVTLEKSSADGKGIGFLMKEMLPDYPFWFTTGAMEFRLLPS